MKEDICELMRQCRKKAGMTRAALSERSGISAETIWRYETGKSMVKFDYVIWILNSCGYDLELKELDNEDD